MDLKTFAYIARNGVKKELDAIGHSHLKTSWSNNPNTEQRDLKIEIDGKTYVMDFREEGPLQFHEDD